MITAYTSLWDLYTLIEVLEDLVPIPNDLIKKIHSELECIDRCPIYVKVKGSKDRNLMVQRHFAALSSELNACYQTIVPIEFTNREYDYVVSIVMATCTEDATLHPLSPGHSRSKLFAVIMDAGHYALDDNKDPLDF